MPGAAARSYSSTHSPNAPTYHPETPTYVTNLTILHPTFTALPSSALFASSIYFNKVRIFPFRLFIPPPAL